MIALSTVYVVKLGAVAMIRKRINLLAFLGFLVVLSVLGGCLPAEGSIGVVIDSTASPGIVEIDFRGAGISGLSLVASQTVSFGPADQFEFYLGDRTFKPEAGQSGYYLPRAELPKDEEVRPAGFRLYDQQGQFLAQDEVSVRLIF